MDRTPDSNLEYQELIRSSQRQLRWYRRLMARLGLQGKLIIAFMLLSTISLELSCMLYMSQSDERLTDIMGEQARQIASTLSLAIEPALENGNSAALRRIGQDLLKTRNVLFVSFYDQSFKPVFVAHRDPEFQTEQPTAADEQTRTLMQVQKRNSPLFGDYLQVSAPVVVTLPGSESTATAAGATRLVGYVAVGISQAQEQVQLRRVELISIGIGALMAVLSLPIALVVVHRIFQPIRQLVDAANRIAAGNLDAHVAVDRPDIIGTLARAFNEMVKRVRSQQQDLAQANHDLEEKVLQRTGQLESANKRLSSEIAEKEDFLRAVSHDLNAPLRNISGMASMLLVKHREKFDEDIIHRLERIQKNVEAETDLISELLELSRIKTRRQKLEPVPVASLVRDLEGLLENDLRSRRISLVTDTELPTINCERARFRQVFQNLVDNAIKYMGDGPTREIHVGCIVRENEAEFYVRDTGMGIDPEDLDKVFFVFRRGKNPAARNVAGKGVGLASVKSIVETYNGSIWVESKLAQGSTFRFTVNGRFVVNGQEAGESSTAAGEAQPLLATAQEEYA